MLSELPTNERAVGRALFEEFDPLSTTLVLDTTSNKDFVLDLLDPNLLLQEAVAASPALGELFAKAANRFGSGPDHVWSIVLGFDEFTPGNGFRLENKKRRS